MSSNSILCKYTHCVINDLLIISFHIAILYYLLVHIPLLSCQCDCNFETSYFTCILSARNYFCSLFSVFLCTDSVVVSSSAAAWFWLPTNALAQQACYPFCVGKLFAVFFGTYELAPMIWANIWCFASSALNIQRNQ